MGRDPNPFTQHIIKALISSGYAEETAKMIAYGQQEMKSLTKAMKMSQKPWYISTSMWAEIYKKKKSTTQRS